MDDIRGIDDVYREEEPDSDDLSPTQVGYLRRRDAISNLLANDSTQYWIWSILSQAGIFNSVSSVDPYAMAIASGKRDLGLLILADIINYNPSAFAEMQRKAAEGKFDGS